MLNLLVLAVMDVPLKTKSIQQVLELEVIGLVQVGQEAVEKFTTAHPGGGFCGAGKINVNNLRHHLLIIDSRAQFLVLPFFDIGESRLKISGAPRNLLAILNFAEAKGQIMSVFVPGNSTTINYLSF